MAASYAVSILLAATAALASLAGGAFVVWRSWGVRTLRYFIAVGSGFMLGTVFLEMIPESTRTNTEASFWLLAGFLVVHLFEHVFSSHLHFGEETHREELTNPAVGFSAIVGMIVHTFFDGVAIGAGLMVSVGFGVLIFLAVLLHKVPDGFTVASIVLTSGGSRKSALIATGILGISTIAGAILVRQFENLMSLALPLSTGSTLYVAASDLLPEVNREPGVRMAFLVFGGVGLFLLCRWGLGVV